MDLWKPWRAERASLPMSPTLTDVLDRNDVLDVVEGTIIVTPKEPKKLVESLTAIDRHEMGSAVASPFTGYMRDDYNPELRGISGLLKYDVMRKSDATVRGTLREVKTPLLAGRWFVEPGPKDTAQDKKIAEFVEHCLTDYMVYNWECLLPEVLLFIDYGYYMFEKVWDTIEVDGEMRTVPKKLAPRHPLDVTQWLYDSKGGPNAVKMSPYAGANDDVEIPIDKLLVFTNDKEGGNMEGVSVLRSAYKHWYMKDNLYKIDAIQKERHGIGVPIIKLPPGFTPLDRGLAENMGRNLRTNDRAHVVLPPNWELMFAKLEGQRVDALESANHHDMQIQKNVLAPFLDKPEEEKKQTLFLKATRYFAEIVTSTMNHFFIRQLVDYNFDVDPYNYPKLRVRRIGEWEDLRTMSFTLRNLVGAKLITPDEELETSIRHEMDIPPADMKTRRETVTPQAPGGPAPAGQPGDGTTDAPGARVGPPRQKTSPPVGPPRANAGSDRSGGQ